nr:unnamed protein product [Callosobruchus analis]
MLFVNDQDVPLNWLKRSEKALPRTQKCHRRRAQQFGVSETTLRHILKNDLHLFPYEVQLTQKILTTDRARRLEYAQTVVRMTDTEPDFRKKILMTEEAHFTLSGSVNRQNCRIWERKILTRFMNRYCMIKE